MDKKKILIVDDEQQIVQLITTRLKYKGYEVIQAYNGNECLQKVKNVKPDLIILDIMMPGIDGNVVADKLKHDPATANIPIIFLTCLIKKEEETESQNIVGGNIFIAKPFNSEKLIEVIEQLLAK